MVGPPSEKLRCFGAMKWWSMNAEYVALGMILAGALYLFWTQKQRTDVTALLVVLGLIIPWPHLDGQWRGILTYQEGFSGFGSAAVIMVASMFVLGAAMVRTGAAEGFGGKLFRACFKRCHYLVLRYAVLFRQGINCFLIVIVCLPHDNCYAIALIRNKRLAAAP